MVADYDSGRAERAMAQVDETTEVAQVKVLDFGVARATEGDARSTAMRKHGGQVIGTLA